MNKSNIKNLFLASVALCLLSSCEKELEAYSNPDCYLNFRYITLGVDEMSEDITDDMINTPVTYNFKMNGDVTSDTVWVKAKTAGFVANYDRTYSIEQVQVEGENNAVAGTDYVAFDDANFKNSLVVKAGQNQFEVPVVVLRNSKLSSETVVLKIRFKENENFKNGYENMQTRTISFTDRFTKPNAWDEHGLDYIFGEYGDLKYQLMREWSGMAWDDDFINEMYNSDSAYLKYLDQVFAKRLAKENEERLAQGLEVYTEADGTEVSFDPMSW